MNKSATSAITLPNIITIVGIISVILVFLTSLKPFIFILISLTLISDLLDGFLARTLNQKTEIGRDLDAVRDTIFLTWFASALIHKGTPIEAVTLLYIIQIILIITHTNLKENNKFHSLHKYSISICYLSSYAFIVFGINLKIFLITIYPILIAYTLASISIFIFLNKKAVD